MRRLRFCLLVAFTAQIVMAGESIQDQNALDSSSLAAEHRSDDYGADLSFTDRMDPWPLSQPEMPAIKILQVQCEKSFMRVSVEFDRPFYGMIFSKGYYSDSNCIHVQPGAGTLHAQFDIFLNSCGMTSSSSALNLGQPTPSGTFIENVVIIQYDPLVQEVWDAARKLRCTWYDYYEKSVTFRPYQVDMLNAVTANFLGDNLQCWMQIQVGKGPWASEVSGIVKIGQTMTMVLAIKDDENKFDMMVRNCVAHDGKRAPIQLVDERGCVTRPKIMGRFQKVKNFGSSASVVSYAHFQAFKFPDSMNVHFQCVIQVCRYSCPEPQCEGFGPPGIGGPIGGPLGGQLGIGGPQPLPPGFGLQGPQGYPGPQGLGPQGFGPQGFGPQDFGFRADASNQVPAVGLPDPRRPNSQGEFADASEKREQFAVAPQRKSDVDAKEQTVETPKPIEAVNIPQANRNRNGPKAGPASGTPKKTYTNVNRQGAAMDSAGRPRELDLDAIDVKTKDEASRSRRATTTLHVYRRAAQEMTDISTQRVIQVVAPGDVAFNLNSANETVVVSELVEDGSSICMSTTGFAAGLIMLLLVLCIACLVACFLYTRIRAFNIKGGVTTFVQGFDNPQFVKVSEQKN